MIHHNHTTLTSSTVEQLSLDLFPPCSFDELCAQCTGITLTVHINPRLKSNWYVKIHRGQPVRELHIPQILDDAPEAVKRAAVNWATLPSPRLPHLKKEVKCRQRHYEAQIRSFLNDRGAATRRRPPVQKWPTIGRHYDLREVFDSLNDTFFRGTLRSFLRWGSPTSRTSFQATRHDSDGQPYHCITIAGMYNHPEVPRFAIDTIMFHEMLHIHIPPRRENGRNVYHGPDFKKMEQSFPHYAQWHRWEKTVLPYLSRRYPRKQPLRQFGKAAARLLFH
ncbi:MAG: M48 family metallopeptidase [Chitinispirillaceae bacterium]|nr:M48 family metallopeptidase [Chitinispirillaceae bacterium]